MDNLICFFFLYWLNKYKKYQVYLYKDKKSKLWLVKNIVKYFN